jgi:uncharacterized protein YkwD
VSLLKTLGRLLFGPAPLPPATQPPTPPTPPPAPQPPVGLPPAIDWELLAAVNDARIARGLPRLRADAALCWAAADHAADLDRRRYFAHDSPEGRTHQQRAEARGYRGITLEVLGWNYPDAAAMTSGWLRSPGHRRAILDPAGVALGAARVGAYHVALVGHVAILRSPSAPLDSPMILLNLPPDE